MANNKIDKGFEVRMYRLGTGDCFALKLFTKGEKPIKILIDCGAKSGTKKRLKEPIADLLNYVDYEVDILIVTHEHTDHVLGFDKCSNLFSSLTVNQLWLGWTENDRDSKVKEWKAEYGKKKLQIKKAIDSLEKITDSGIIKSRLNDKYRSRAILNLHSQFNKSLKSFANLNGIGSYVNGLKGMEFIKKNLNCNTTKFLKAGDIEQYDSNEKLKFYILGPPSNWDYVKKEHGKGNESYKHNKDLDFVKNFSGFDYNESSENLFDKEYITRTKKIKNDYSNEEWRMIDFEWLNMVGGLALRLNRGVNNLSLVIAIEFVDTGEILLFPGDAEIGSWESWHEIQWKCKKDGEQLTTEDILNRTIFYKVAHHMSHNGTAKELGLEMMTDPNLTAMATIDYSVIHSNWKNTMPNRMIMNELLRKTQGRLILMNNKNIFCDKEKKIPFSKRKKEFPKQDKLKHKFYTRKHFHQYTRILEQKSK